MKAPLHVIPHRGVALVRFFFFWCGESAELFFAAFYCSSYRVKTAASAISECISPSLTRYHQNTRFGSYVPITAAMIMTTHSQPLARPPAPTASQDDSCLRYTRGTDGNKRTITVQRDLKVMSWNEGWTPAIPLMHVCGAGDCHGKLPFLVV